MMTMIKMKITKTTTKTTTITTSITIIITITIKITIKITISGLNQLALCEERGYEIPVEIELDINEDPMRVIAGSMELAANFFLSASVSIFKYEKKFPLFFIYYDYFLKIDSFLRLFFNGYVYFGFFIQEMVIASS